MGNRSQPAAPAPLVELGYRPDLLNSNLSRWLDHFRWLSALMVAASHLRNMLMPDAAHLGPLAAVFYFFTLFAEQAVVVFFVLSGLLVGGVIVRGAREGRFAPGKYAVDRVSRLYVALVPALVAVKSHRAQRKEPARPLAERPPRALLDGPAHHTQRGTIN